MRYWDDLREPNSNYVQCPFGILQSDISHAALRAYMVLWHDAFTNQRWFKGTMYAEMSYREIGHNLGCSIEWARQVVKELLDHKFVERLSQRGRKNRYRFIKQRFWEVT